MSELGKDKVSLKGVDLTFMHAPPAKPGKPAAPPEQAVVDEGVGSAPDDSRDGQPEPSGRGDATASPSPGAARTDAGEQPPADKVKPIIAYVPVQTRNKLRKVATDTGRSFTDVLFDAVDDLDARLPEVFAEHLAAAPPQSLFSRRSRRATTSTATKSKGVAVQVPFRPYAEDLAVLDDRAATYAAGNRSEFIRIVLQEYLSK